MPRSPVVNTSNGTDNPVLVTPLPFVPFSTPPVETKTFSQNQGNATPSMSGAFSRYLSRGSSRWLVSLVELLSKCRHERKTGFAPNYHHTCRTNPERLCARCVFPLSVILFVDLTRHETPLRLWFRAVFISPTRCTPWSVQRQCLTFVSGFW